jgi:hypothetical protein
MFEIKDAIATSGEDLNLVETHHKTIRMTADASDNMVHQTQYRAWGEKHYSNDSKQTNYDYTGQYSYTDDFGLMFYNTLWCDPYLNQFP